MPAKKPHPVETHFEKALLGIAVLVLLYVLFAFTISSPTSVMIDTTPARPGEAYKLVREKAEELETRAKKKPLRARRSCWRRKKSNRQVRKLPGRDWGTSNPSRPSFR